jgi:hypothetical protein
MSWFLSDRLKALEIKVSSMRISMRISPVLSFNLYRSDVQTLRCIIGRLVNLAL